MSAVGESNAKQLALRLATIDQASRETLLAELPKAKQDELQGLIHELEPFQVEFSTFELAMAEFEMAASRKPLSFSESHLQQLLVGESFAIKQQLMDVLVRSCNNRLTPHVRTIISNYLQKKLSTLPDEPIAAKPVKPWWNVWS